MSSRWDQLSLAAPTAIDVDGIEVRRGSRVRLRPRAGRDIFDLVLAGRIAIVESIEQEIDGALHLAVTVEDDPGRELGEARRPGHRFFYAVDEVEPLGAADAGAPGPAPARTLVAGIGNTWLGDDGFGVELAAALRDRPLPAGVEVTDFGIRGMDLALALRDYDHVLMLDAVPRGEPPGTLSVIEPELPGAAAEVEPHGMDPVRVLRLAAAFGGPLPRVLVVGCEPQRVEVGEDGEPVTGLTPVVRAAIPAAVELVESLLAELVEQERS